MLDTNTILFTVKSWGLYIVYLILSIFKFLWLSLFLFFKGIFKLILLLFSSINELLNHIFEKIISIAENKNELMKYIFFIIAIIGFTFTLNYASNDPTASTVNITKYIYPLSVAILGTLSYVFVKDYINVDFKIVLFSLSTLGLIFGTSLYYISSEKDTPSTLLYVLSGVATFGIIIGLTIVFYFLSNYIKSLEGWGGFFTHLLFYIPCLVLDFIRYIQSEIGATTNVVYYLFVLEILAALLYIYIPKLVNEIIRTDGVQLLKDAVFLDIKKELGSGYNLAFKNIGYDDTAITTYRRSYSISMWIYLNMQPPNYNSYAKETEIFNYGNGLPKITYIDNVNTDGNKSPDMIRIYFTNTGSNIETISRTLSIKPQKWNQLVLNYTSSQVDIFLNGHLEKTYIIPDNNQPRYSAGDIISVGSENGLDGSICNIKFHNKPQSKGAIASSYNLLMKYNPPVNNL